MWIKSSGIDMLSVCVTVILDGIIQEFNFFFIVNNTKSGNAIRRILKKYEILVLFFHQQFNKLSILKM